MNLVGTYIEHQLLTMHYSKCSERKEVSRINILASMELTL